MGHAANASACSKDDGATRAIQEIGHAAGTTGGLQAADARTGAPYLTRESATSPTICRVGGLVPLGLNGSDLGGGTRT
jgi:hypothetical protein